MANPPFDQAQTGRQKGRGDFRDLKKHFVRVNGWLPPFQRYARETQQVRYLTLCSKEAIDVRYFAQKGVLARNAEANLYPSLTFIESDEEDYAVIAETLGRVRLGIHARLEDVLLNQQHPSHDELESSFPYHIINLDFCGDIVPRGDHPYSQTMRCIEKLVQLQAASGIPRWHLFLTFRAQRTNANDEANTQLRDLIEGNFQEALLREAYGDRPAPDQLLAQTYPEFLRVSIAKFLAHTARNQAYRVNVESSWVYGRHQGAYHIVKLVAALSQLRPLTAIPNPPRELQAYEETVMSIFGSRATDVDHEVGAVSAALEEELRPVLDELVNRGIVVA